MLEYAPMLHGNYAGIIRQDLCSNSSL